MHLVLIRSARQIAAAVRRLSAEITADYEGEELLLVVVLQGAFIFAADLVRQLQLPLEMDFVRLKSYSGMETTGSVVLAQDLDLSVTGRNVLVVEDIVDTGITLAYLLEVLRQRGPKSLKVCTLIDKPSGRRVAVTTDYVGMICKGGFLIGYGLDIDGMKRELPNIYEVRNFPQGRSE